MLIDAKIIKALLLFADKKDVRPSVNHLNFEKNRIVATNGVLLGCYNHPCDIVGGIPLTLFGKLPLKGEISIEMISGMACISEGGVHCSDVLSDHGGINYPELFASEPSGVVGQFIPSQLMLFEKAAKILGFYEPRVRLGHNGTNPAWVAIADPNFIGAISPLVESWRPTLPEWFNTGD